MPTSSLLTKVRSDRVHTQFLEDTTPVSPLTDRRYTITRSSRTKHIYVSIGRRHNEAQVDGRYQRVVRDEVLAQWVVDAANEQTATLHVHVHVSGGHVLGSPGARIRMFRRILPAMLQSLHVSDGYLFKANPWLLEAPVWVHFHTELPEDTQMESFGTLAALTVPGA